MVSIRTFNVTSTINTPPGSPARGQTHIVGDTPTDDFVDHEGELAVWTPAANDGAGAWAFSAPSDGERRLFADTGLEMIYDNSETEWFAGSIRSQRPTTKTWTGRKVGSDKVYGKEITLSGLANNDRARFALGEAGLTRVVYAEGRIAQTGDQVNSGTLSTNNGTSKVTGTGVHTGIVDEMDVVLAGFGGGADGTYKVTAVGTDELTLDPAPPTVSGGGDETVTQEPPSITLDGRTYLAGGFTIATYFDKTNAVVDTNWDATDYDTGELYFEWIE
jgi:hypothetical protein